MRNRANTVTAAQSSLPRNAAGPSTSLLANMREAVRLVRSIGSGHRLMILCLLMDGARTVTQISEALGARRSLMSQHLSRLRADGLVEAERQGNFVLYSLTDTPAKHVVATLHSHFCPQGLAASVDQWACRQKHTLIA